MKILLVFTLCLISGPVSCFDVIGYSGGSVMIHCRDKQYGVINKYFCKETANQTPKQCVLVRFQNKWRHIDRFSLRDSSEVLTVIYRNLSLQDAGLYRCGEAGEWNHTVNLEVKTDPCCLGSNTVAGYLGETVTISCSYPEEFKTNSQFLLKQDGEGFTEVNRTKDSQRGRFSISDDRSSAVLSVRISDVREDDGGVYYCGVWTGGGQWFSSYSLYSEIQLQVTAKETSPSPKQPPTVGPSSAKGTRSEEHFTSGSPVIIPVCVCVALLLVGGSALIFYKLRCNKQQGSSSTSRRSGIANTADSDYENDPPRNQNNINMDPVYQNPKPNTNQTDSIYQSLNLNTIQPDSVYQSLNPKTNQSDSVY